MSFVPLHPAPRRILIVKPSAIGDVVHTLPIFNLIKRRWPQAKVSWLASPVCAPLLEGHRQIEEVIVFNRKRYGHAWRSPTASTAFFQFISGLKARQFDWAVDFQGLFRSGWMSWMSGAPVRVGFEDAREGAPAFYTHIINSGGWWHQHAIGRYQHLAAALGCENEPIEFEFATNDTDRAEAAAMVPLDVPYAVLVPGSMWVTKQWPPEKFNALAKPLRERFGLQTVVLGSAKEVGVAGQIESDFNLAGKTTLRQSIALLERAQLVVANDSGPMHIASGLRRPLVALFGPTHPVLTGPYGRLDSVIRLDLPCSPCYGRTCAHRSCLNWLDVEAVLTLAEKQIKRYGDAFPF
jgi:lipopolysaccharide heptosyltransferase II